jgi:hypothetical protein
MSARINHSGFDNAQVYGLRKLSQEETVIQKKIGELKRVTGVLTVKTWTKDDVDSSLPGNRIHRLFEESDMLYFKGTG